MADITLYHNPNCSKSRVAREILEAKGVDFDVVEYLQAPLSAVEILDLLERLADSPEALVRKDGHFKELGLDAADFTTAEAVAGLLADHPRLMQRPVLVKGDRAVIARPPELVEALI